MFGSKKADQDPLEQLGAALERYLEEVINPDNRENIPDEIDPVYQEAVEKINDFGQFLMESQIDKVLTGNQVRFMVINFLLTSFAAENLARSDAGFIVTPDEWANLYPDRPFPTK